MFSHLVRQASLVFSLKLVILGLSIAASAQTPTTRPTPTTTQQEATQPPGTTPNPNLPQEARPTTNPQAPPGAQPRSPQAAPGVTTQPSTTQPTGPTQTATPVPSTTTPTDTTTAPSIVSPQSGVVQDPVYPNEQPRPVPPLPSLVRLGVSSDTTIPFSLNDAIRRALEQNNDIEMARQDVRFAETTLRALEGVYEPTLNFNPQINNVVESQQSTLGGASGSSGNVTRTDFQLNNSAQKLVRTGGGSYEFFFNNNRRTTNSTFNQLNPVYSGSLGVQFTQPLVEESLDR